MITGSRAAGPDPSTSLDIRVNEKASEFMRTSIFAEVAREAERPGIGTDPAPLPSDAWLIPSDSAMPGPVLHQSAAVRDATWITRLAGPQRGYRVAVKDLLDIEGTITTAGCVAVERRAVPAPADAVSLRGIREAEADGRASIVGKTNLHELAFGADGINPAFGTPVNPIDEQRIPGGSSSGSAVAVANHEADLGIGSDTGGSIRIPAACCGIVGLKTTCDRVPVRGCWPLAPFLDTIGPLARTVSEVIVGMDMIEAGFVEEVSAAGTRMNRRIGRVVGRLAEVAPVVQAAVDATLDRFRSECGVEIVDVEIPGWEAAHAAGLTVLLGEAWRSNRDLLRGSGVGDDVAARLRLGEHVSPDALVLARAERATITEELRALMRTHRLDVLAMPTMPTLAPLLGDVANSSLTALTRLANISGSPAIAMPAAVPASARHPTTAHLPASLQLVGLPGDDALVCAVASLLP